MPDSASFFRYWGKTRRTKDEQGAAYHLLPWHNLDVAACGWLMVMENRFHAADIFHQLGLSRHEAARWFAWALALHDIGKYARGFQQLNKTPFPELVPAVSGIAYADRHDSLGYWLWQEHLRPRWEEGGEALPAQPPKSHISKTLDLWLKTVTGHHGKPPKAAKGSFAFTPEDKAAAEAWLTELRQLLCIDEYPAQFSDKAWRERFRQQSWLLAGLTVLADWTGSSPRDFPLVSEVMPVNDYWKIALSQAELALAQLPQPTPVSEFTHYSQLFPQIQQLTPLQQRAVETDLSAAGPHLLVLEDVTGAGKTEAALILAHRLMAGGKGDSLYFGLPTMATSNAMFQRLAQAWRGLFCAGYHPSLVLAHGSSQMSADFSRSLFTTDNPGLAVYQAGEQTASGACNRWFTDSRKKSLLAEVGVGTLDQALMAAMPYRHQSLRLLGLYGKILLLDEVHAYDGYMVRLLEGLLTFHAAQGGSAIILSATLPTSLRRRLLDAFQLGVDGGSVRPNPMADYPWFSHLNAQGLEERFIATRPEVTRHVAVQWIHDPQQACELIRRAVEAGQCICWIRNTVDDAIASYRQLRDSGLIPPQDLLLFHSRFAFVDRMATENKTLAWFGKQSTPEIRHGKVLIATQVVEQSLDIDLDVMISDLAPIDLLIQRAGRLQRHTRDEKGKRKAAMPDERQAPTLHILAPDWQPEAKAGWLGEHLSGTGFVYEDHACLWRTQSILQDKGVIRMPEDARELVESVYEAWIAAPEGLQQQEDKVYGKGLSIRAAAEQSLLHHQKGYDRRACDAGWNEEVELSTRLSEASVDLYLARPGEGNEMLPYAQEEDFAWPQSRLSVREKLWQKIAAQAPHLQGDELEAFRMTIHNPRAQVLLMAEEITAFYSKEWGLVSQRPD